MEVLRAGGFEVESLSAFAENFTININDSLKNIFLVHKNKFVKAKAIAKGLTGFYEIPLNMKTHNLAPYDCNRILRSMSRCFNSSAAVEYLIEECYLLSRTDADSFESIFNYQKMNNSLLAASSHHTSKKRLWSDRALAQKIISNVIISEERPAKKMRPISPDMMENFEITGKSTKIRLKPSRKKKIARLQWEPSALKMNFCNPAHDEFCINPILYDTKQRTSWPKKNALSTSSTDKLLSYIINIQLKVKHGMNDEWELASDNWTQLRNALHQFISRENNLSRNNGYLRLLQSFSDQGDGAADMDIKPFNKANVANYVCCILRKVLPIELFGGKKCNFKKFISAALQLVKSAKNQSFILESFTQHFPRSAKWREELPLYFRHLMTTKITKFLILDYVLGVLRNIFFITESSSSSFELYFYRKGDVESVTSKVMKEMVFQCKLTRLSQHCLNEKSDEEKSVENQNVICADNCWCRFPTVKVRLLPKTESFSTMRMITVKSSRDHWIELDKVKLLLECLLSVSGTGIKPVPSDLRLASAWNKVTKLKDRDGSKLYYVKTDIRDAFGSVKHSKLFDILEKVLPSNKNSVMPLITMKEWAIRRGKIVLLSRKSFSRKVSRNRVLHSRIAGNYYSLLQLKNIILQVVEHQQLNLGGQLFRMTVGLCQGGAGALSPLLCDLYYSAMDQEYLQRYRTDDSSVLIRAADDYLYVTVNRARAESFHRLILKGIEEYNTSFNTEKLATNLFVESPQFSYLGLLFNVETLLVEPNYYKYETGNILRTVKLSNATGDIHFSRDKFIYKKLQQISGLKLVNIVFRCEYVNTAHLRKVICRAFLAQLSKALMLSLMLRPPSLNLMVILTKLCTQLSRVVTKICDKISHKEIMYIYWKSALHVYNKYTGNFSVLPDLVKLRLCQLYNHFEKNNCIFIMKLLEEDISDVLNQNVTEVIQ